MIREKKGTLIENVFETIAELNGKSYKMLVASNGVRAYVEAILETYGLKKYFSEPFIYPEGDIVNKTGVIEYYISALGDPEIIMIGDRYTDLEAAVENKIPFIGCAFGHAGADEIAGERYIVHNFKEIPEMVKEIAD
jgi:adenosylhomocysteine nucleosidase